MPLVWRRPACPSRRPPPSPAAPCNWLASCSRRARNELCCTSFAPVTAARPIGFRSRRFCSSNRIRRRDDSRTGGHMRTLLTIALTLLLLLNIGCGRGNSGPTVAASYEGQGEEITADPKFELAITIDGTPVSLPLKTLSIFESKPADKDAKAAPQGFELEGDDVMIAGYLPADLQVAPGH